MSQRRPWRHVRADDQLLRDLLGPDLPGRAACTGLAPMFDLAIDREPLDARERRHAAAVRTCTHCPVLDACDNAARVEPRPVGVWAGRVIDPSATGRPATS